MLAGKGIANVINVAGGIKAWDSNKAVGAEDLGLELFEGNESLEEVLVVAYSLEKGLMEFYGSLAAEIRNEEVQGLFEKLTFIEEKHQETIFSEYSRASGTTLTRDEFEKNVVVTAMEGGFTTSEYLDRYAPDLEVVEDVVGFAMMIEAQALDLYQRVSDRATSVDVKVVLLRIANEERAHLKLLGTLLD